MLGNIAYSVGLDTEDSFAIADIVTAAYPYSPNNRIAALIALSRFDTNSGCAVDCRPTPPVLTADGVFLLHTIGRAEGPGFTDAFTDTYIFPGGYIPANVDFGLRDEKYGPALYKAIKQIMSDFEAEQGLN